MSVEGPPCPSAPSPPSWGQGRAADAGPITQGGWCPFECLSPGPHARPEAPAPESQAAVMTLEESVPLDRWVHRVPEGEVITSGPGTNEREEREERPVPCSCPWDLCPRVTLSPAEHPCAAPCAFTFAIPSGISLKHKESMSLEQCPERYKVVTAPLPQRHLPAEAPESRAQYLDGEGKGDMLCHLSESHPNLQP